MPLPDKTTTPEQAVAAISDGAMALISGFGLPAKTFRHIQASRHRVRSA